MTIETAIATGVAKLATEYGSLVTVIVCGAWFAYKTGQALIERCDKNSANNLDKWEKAQDRMVVMLESVVNKSNITMMEVTHAMRELSNNMKK